MTYFIGPIVIFLLSSIAFNIHYIRLSKRQKSTISKLEIDLKLRNTQIDALKKTKSYSLAQVNQIILNPPKFKVKDMVGEMEIISIKVDFISIWTLVGVLMAESFFNRYNLNRDFISKVKEHKDHLGQPIYSYCCSISKYCPPFIKTEKELIELLELWNSKK